VRVVEHVLCLGFVRHLSGSDRGGAGTSSTAEGEARIGGEEIEASLSPVAEPVGQIVEAQEIGDVVLTALRAVGHGSGSALPFEDRVWHASQWRSSKRAVARLQYASRSGGAGDAARAKRVRVERLAGEALVTYGAGSALRDAQLAVVPGGRIVAEANELETVRELVARGLGVSLMPRSVVASHGDRLAIRPLSPRQALPVSLVWRAGERPTPAAQAFRDHVLSTMRN
jgi:hypothetical protein